MAPWHLLDPKEEEELHKSRLLNVEEKPFKRITKRMQALHSLAKWGNPPPAPVATAVTDSKQNQPNGVSSQPSTPTPATTTAGAEVEKERPLTLPELHEELKLDFAAFDSSILRLQFLLNANEEERARYAADRQTILDTCQEVRKNNSSLRTQLEQAKVALERRRRLDDLADKITSNRMLRPRDDQRANLAKLEEECAQLEEESETYAVTWRERRDQFARIMEESMRLRRQIRDEKEEVDRREGMGDEDEDRAGDDAPTPRPGIASGNATPVPGHHQGAALGGSSLASKVLITGLEGQDSSTAASRPASVTGGRTPARDSPGPQDGLLKPRPDASGSLESQRSAPSSQPDTPAEDATADRRDGDVEDGEDVEMDGSAVGARSAAAAGGGASAGDTPMTDTQATTENTPRITVDGQDVVEDKMDTT